MLKIFAFAILLLSVSAANLASIPDTACLSLATAKISKTKATMGNCLSTAKSAGSATACCIAEFAQNKLTVSLAAGTGADVVSVMATTGMSASNAAVGGSLHCFAPGGYIIHKPGTNADGAGLNSFVLAAPWCGATGDVAAVSATATTEGKTFYTVAGTDYATTGTEVLANQAAVGSRLLAATARSGVFIADGIAASCDCGDSGMPTDKCATFATTTAGKLKTDCTGTDDGSGSKKCCLATFAATPKTPSQADNLATADIAIVAPTAGGEVTSGAYYACYKDKIRFKTGALTTTTDGVGVEAWVASALFCADDKKGTAVPTATFTHTVDVAVTGAATAGARKGLTGTATCACGSANVFTIGFVLLAILASLWK